MSTRQEILKAAGESYQQLKDYMHNHHPSLDNWWRVGNCFDTLTDYLCYIRPHDPDPALLDYVLAEYKHTEGTACWYDDYGWWVIACVKAYDPQFNTVFVNSSYRDEFTKIARDCWKIMDTGKDEDPQIHRGAPQAFENIDNRKGFVVPPTPEKYWVTPRFDNGRGKGLRGVWQYDIFSNERSGDNYKGPPECNAETNPSWPKTSTLGPYQLTVVNGLYFLAAVRLEMARLAPPGNPAVPPAATQLADEYGFLKAWFGKDPANPIEADLALLGQVGGDKLQVRERVSSYAFHDGEYPKDPIFKADRTWGGDQGLILNALCGYWRMHRHDDIPRDLLQPLIKGYLALMMGSGKPHSFYPYEDTFFKNDCADYKSGIGVFMRGVLQSFLSGAAPVADIMRSKEGQEFLNKSADWAVGMERKDGFDCLNVLATATAALMMLRDAG